MAIERIGILTSGGDCAGLNAVIRTARGLGICLGEWFGLCA